MTAVPGRIVNVHEAKGGKPWARLVPLEPPRARRVPGVLTGRLNLPPLEVLLEQLPEEELAAMEQPLLILATGCM